MSQYPPPYGYGQYHGQPPPQAYAYPNVPGYPASAAIPYNPSMTPSHRDASQAAYGMNVTHIPGLGMGGAAPVDTYGTFASGAASWNQPNGPPALTSNAPPQTHCANPFNFDGPQPSPSGASRSAVPPSTQPAQGHPRPSAAVEMEEGELSEGQFEDLYEPREDASDAPAQPIDKPAPLPAAESSQPASTADTLDGGFYGTDEDDGGKDPRGPEGRERSASYSPFLSPREVQSGIPTPQRVADQGPQTDSVQPDVGTQNSTVPGLRPPAQASTTASANNTSSKLEGPAYQSQDDPLNSFKSLQEAKKEAQKAILRLWPLGVKYQNYIDEGFDEKLIKGLFLDLHLDMPKAAASPPDAPSKATLPHQGGGTDSSKSSQASNLQLQATTAAKNTSSMSEQSQKGEERKDRIARLLAAKAAKPPAAPNPPKPAPTAPEKQQPETSSAAQTSTAARGKTWGEKERLLQQKIAALQKAREARKSAEATAGAKAVQGEDSNNGTPKPQGVMTGSPALPSIPTGPRAPNGLQRPANSQPALSQPRPSLPGLALTANVPQITSNQRKRPVALDFVDYPSGPSVAKRPFAQPRQETSLIIDVSDESDDGEMEMDMDMGSPIEETMPVQSGGMSSQHGPVIRDFPSLTDTSSKRQLSSPAPSVTPPGGRVNRTTELDLKEKAIQEMRRKIALAEAKRKVKQSAGGSVTPNRSETENKVGEGPRPPLTQTTESTSSQGGSERGSSGPTPEPSTAKPPEPSETHLDPLQRAQRRGRIMSLEIPRVESSLSEKMKRLKQLQDEEERLKAEIERSIAEQKKLAAELQQLDTASPSTEAARPNGSEAGNGGGQPFQSQPRETSSDRQEDESSVSQTGSVTANAQTRRSSFDQSVSGEKTGDGLNEGQTPSNQSEERPAAHDGDGCIGGREMGNSADHPHERTTETEASPPKSDAVVQGNAGGSPIPSSEPTPAANNAAASDVPEQLGSPNADETTPMELESQSPSPQAVEHASSANAESPAPLPDQISGPAQPREAAQEIETEVAGEVHVVSSPATGTSELTEQQVQGYPVSKPESTLKPYQSPLRYFHAYRFHPEYPKAVAGGLRSLTYSNRIDPDKELCPSELTGEQCPTNCEYQHFSSISAPDDQILLELGNSDDFTGDQKSGFIQGLRELLQKFKADKVKDFDTIARGIIEFRSKFLGDKSKVLRLEGVTI
ncbi:hypothetical protein L209DRAFT_767256 [Thermothelomyces heterothallicus CBS 203.75]